MSDEQLDNEFKKRIKEVFDNYEDDTAHEGWTLLREKYPERKSDRVVAWLWRYVGVAAVLLALLSVGLWFNGQHKHAKSLAVKNSGHKGPIVVNPAAIVKSTPHHVNPSVNTAQQGQRNTPAHAQQVIRPAGRGLAVATVNHPSIHPINNKTPASNYNPTFSAPINNATKSNTAYQPQTGPVIATNNVKTPDAVNAQKDDATTLNNDNTTRPATTNKQPANPVLAMLDTSKKAPAVVTKKQSDKSIQSLFDNDNRYAAAHNSTNDIKIKRRSVVFGVYAATYFNYAKGSSNQFNAGGGISADIRLSEKLSIVTGVAIAQNSFNYNSITGTAPTVPIAAALAVSNATYYGNAATLSSLSPTSKNLNASLIGLDVPVDLKYLFNPKKGNLYVAAGFSSGAFINETYNYSYSYNIDNNKQPSQDASTRKSFDNFYIAKMLNLSFGVGYPMGNGNKLFIEPFLKYPITGLGDQHILFGTGGVNLKFNFDTPKIKR